MYGVIDAGATVARSSLTARTILVSTTADGYSVRGFQSNATLPSGSKGWYINLVTNTASPDGERVISTPQIQGSTLIFTTIIPTSDGCQSDGTGWVNALDAFTGTSSATSYFDLDGSGTTTDDTVSKTSGGTTTTVAVGSVALGVGMLSSAVLYNGQLTACGSSGECGTVDTDKLKSARTSWREVLLED
jgi:type IV pilus assembly protein PilY1